MNDFKLDSHKIKPGFTTPGDYFDSFPQRVTTRLEEKPVISLFPKRIKIIYAAAAVLILALFVNVFSAGNSDQLDDATIETYLAYHSGLTQYDMLTLLDQEDLMAIEIDFPVEDEAIEELLATNSDFEQLIVE